MSEENVSKASAAALQRAVLMLQEICSEVQVEITEGRVNTVDEAVTYSDKRYNEMLEAFDTMKEKVRGTPLETVLELSNPGQTLDEVVNATKEQFIDLQDQLTEAVKVGSGQMFEERKVH